MPMVPAPHAMGPWMDLLGRPGLNWTRSLRRRTSPLGTRGPQGAASSSRASKLDDISICEGRHPPGAQFARRCQAGGVRPLS